MREENKFFYIEEKNSEIRFGVLGDWVIRNAGEIEKLLDELTFNKLPQKIVFHCNGLTGIDTSGAWILYKKFKELEHSGCDAEFIGFRESHFKFVKSLFEISDNHCPHPYVKGGVLDNLEGLGRLTLKGFSHIIEAFCFIGKIFVIFCRSLLNPRHLRFSSIVRHVHETGVKALPIVALMAFLVSVVLTYQGSLQLQKFGATIFTVDLVSISVLREMGVLMTAILVAGRSGSAFAAEIGVMKLREEVDAMKTMGIEPFEVLVLPRIIGLVIALPLLTIFADLIGLVAGGLMGITVLDISCAQYLDRLMDVVTVKEFYVGLSKAPVFAFIIATVGTFRGMQVEGSSESIGRLTTISVVQSIFLVILADAIFSIIYAELGI